MNAEKVDDDKAKKEALKEKVFNGVCAQYFLSVFAHTMNLQSEAILLRNACGGDLAKAAQVGSVANAASGVLGLIMNQLGAKLSDAFGRRPFYFVGPLSQLLTGLICFLKSDNAAVLGVFKALKMIGTTFSGTVIGTAAMRDVFHGEEFGIKQAKAMSVVGLGIMAGPFCESLMLKVSKERTTYLGLAALGALAACIGLVNLPETVMDENKREFDFNGALKAVNPFGFLKLFTHGSPAVKKLASIITLQTVIDGKNMSDLVQIWTREHIQMRMETIRNFIMGYGFSSIVAGSKLVPYLMKNLSVYGFTTFTNLTNFIGFVMRGSAANIYMFFGALPLMLPGVNGASTAALAPVLNDHMVACGFGIGESTAWCNNMRVLASALATLMYGNVYARLRKLGYNPGLTFAFAAALGAALPQLLLELTVKRSELDRSQIKKSA